MQEIVDESKSSEEKPGSGFRMNQRVHTVGDTRRIGTVKYIGNVEGYSGIWVGIDWDNGDGKHNGSLNGVTYFEAKDDKSGSFVRPQNLSHGISFLQALELRYKGDSTKEEEDEMYVLSARNNRVAVQLVGKNKVQDKLSRLEDLVGASLSYLGVSSVGSRGQINALVPTMTLLEEPAMHSETSNDLIRRTQTAKPLSLPFAFESGLYNAGMSSSTNPSSFHHKHQFQPAQVILSTPKLELPQPSLTHNLATENPRMSSTWSNTSSTLTSFEQQLLSGMGMQGSQNIFPSMHNSHGSRGPSCTVNNASSIEATRTAGYGSTNATFPIDVRPNNSAVDPSTRNDINRMSQRNSQQLEHGNEGLSSQFCSRPVYKE